MTFEDILNDVSRWEEEDYRVEEICKEIRDNLLVISRKKYG